MKNEILYKIQDSFGDIEARIVKLHNGKFAGHYSVAVFDLETEDTFGSAYIFKDFEAAKTKAETIK